MDLVFKCPKCGQELAVDASNAGEQTECPSCNQEITIPAASIAPPPPPPAPVAEPAAAAGGWANPGAGAIASSAAAKVVMHLSVPVHDEPSESLISKPLPTLEVAAKETDRQLRIKCIRHVDCVEVGHDRFDETVCKFLAKIGDANFVSMNTIAYSIIDVASQKLLTDYGVLIVYHG